MQKRAGAENLGCEIDGEVLGDGGRCGRGGWGRCGYRSRCRCGNLVASSGGHGLDDGCGLWRRLRLDCGICGLHGDGRVCSFSFNLNLRRALILDARLCLDGRGCHGGDAGIGVLGVVDDRERDGGLRRLGLRRRLGSVLICGLVGLIVLGLVAKDIAVLERRRLGLVSGFFGCRLGRFVELHSGFLLGYDFGIGRGGDFGFGFCRYLNSNFDLCLGLGFRRGFNHGFGLGTLNVLGAHGLEVLLTALFLFVGLLGALGGLGLVLALGKRGIPGLVGDDRGIQAAAFKDGQLNAVVELLEQLARGLEAQVISGHVASGERLLDLRHKRLLATSNRIAQQAIQIDVVAQRKRGPNYCLAHGKSPLYTCKASYHRMAFAMAAPKANGREPLSIRARCTGRLSMRGKCA